MSAIILGNLPKLVNSDSLLFQKCISRQYHKIRGRPAGITRPLKERLRVMFPVNPELDFKVNIGYAQAVKSRKADLDKKVLHDKQTTSKFDLEKAARNLQLQVPIDGMKEEWKVTTGPGHIKTIAEHYNVFQDLFGDAYFLPVVMLDIGFIQNDGYVTPVYYGNVIKPASAKSAPDVSFSSKPNDLWTLILTNPDGHFLEPNKEYIHWFVGNIPGNDISKGEVIYDYLQPFPARGTGFQRLIFILYKQEKKLDYSNMKRQTPCLELKNRTFETLPFYRERQNDLTPAGLAFFQCDWDSTLTDFFHKSLNMEEPIFEYDVDPLYMKEQEWYPLRRAFNAYLDRYRDQKQVAKEFLMRRLSKVHPFKKPEPPFPFPNIFPFDSYKTPSWLITEKRRARLGIGRINRYKDDDD